MPTDMDTEGGAGRRARAGVLTAVLSAVVASLFVIRRRLATGGRRPSPPSRFVPVAPCRLLDTRARAADRSRAGGTVDVAGRVRCSAMCRRAPTPPRSRSPPSTRPAVGYVTGWPAGSAKPEASMLNYRTAETVANAQLLQIGTGGRVVAVHARRQSTSWSTSRATSSRPRAPSRPAGSCRSRPTDLIDTVTSGRPAAGTAVRESPSAAMPEVPGGRHRRSLSTSPPRSRSVPASSRRTPPASRFPTPRC